MFENIIGQDEIVAQLKHDIKQNTLAPSLLFAGPRASAKLTCALELARVLSCVATPDEDGDYALWSCACPACLKQRLLVHTDTLLAGPHHLREELKAGLDLFSRAPSRASAFFAYRAARKLLRRFDPLFLEAREMSKTNRDALLRLLGDTEELLIDLDPDKLPTDPAEFKHDLIKKITDNQVTLLGFCQKIEPYIPNYIAVSDIRAIHEWVGLTSIGRHKIVIIENAEAMRDDSRTALLKILEEPPTRVQFILVTARPQALMATTRSRLRPYYFSGRTAEANNVVLTKIFKRDTQNLAIENLQDYFAGFKAFPPADALRSAQRFLASVVHDNNIEIIPLTFFNMPESDIPDRLHLFEELMVATKEFGAKDAAFAGSFRDFLAGLLRVLSKVTHEYPTVPALVHTVSKWTASIKRAHIQVEVYNRRPQQLLEELYFEFTQQL